MKNITKLLLFILYFLTAECVVGDCVNPGLQNESTNIDIKVPVRKDNENLEIHWVDSGEMVSKGYGKITFSIDGLIDFCPNVESIQLVPALFCDDGSEPNYSEAENINNVDNDFGLNLDKVCRGQNANSRRRYIDTGIKVNPGNKLMFSVVPRKMEIKCDDIQGSTDKITLDDRYKTDGNGDVTDLTEICKGGKFFCPGTSMGTEKFKSLEQHPYTILVGNGCTPYDNKVYRNASLHHQWIKGALLDLRKCSKKKLTELTLDQTTRDEIVALCSTEQGDVRKNDCIARKEMEYIGREKKKYGPYELNCTENKICYSSSGFVENCVSSIRYKKYEQNSRCDIYAYLDVFEEKLRSGNIWDEERNDNVNNNEENRCNEVVKERDENISWAESLVAKIVNPRSMRDNLPLQQLDHSEGDQCFPKKNSESNRRCALIDNNDDFKKFSLQLDHEYTVGNVDSQSSVMLAIAGKQNDDYNLYRGGYHIKTRKLCKFARGEKLYLYIGNHPPQHISQADLGDANMFYHLDPSIEHSSEILLKNQEGCNIAYIIDKEKLRDDEARKIYFGIDVRDAVRHEIVSNNTHNRYNINLSTEQRMNNFVSSTVSNILDYIKEHVIQKSSIEGMYKGYASGLLHAIRALLTLYIIFSVMGYMLGTVEAGIHDFIIRIAKIAFVIFVLSERSWEFFGNNLYALFIDGSSYLIDSFAAYDNAVNRQQFAFLDKTVGVLCSAETWLKFLSLMFAGPFGFVAFISIVWATVTFLKCIIIAIIRYLIATVLVGFLLSLAPLFIVFILFQITSDLFRGWIKMLASVSIQPVIAFSLLSLLNELLYSIFYNITNFSACYHCLFSLNFGGYDICIIKAIWPAEYSPSTGVESVLNNGIQSRGYFASLPIDIIQAIIYFIIANALDAFVQISETIAESIFSAFNGIRAITAVAFNASQAALSTVGLDIQTQREIRDIKDSPPSKVTSPRVNMGVAQDKTRQE